MHLPGWNLPGCSIARGLAPYFPALLIWLISPLGCQSSPVKQVPPASSPIVAAVLESGSAPNTKPLVEENLEGAFFTISGKPTSAKWIATGGESRRPLAASSSEFFFSGRRPGLERWQVYNGLLTDSVEKRISYDAGEVEPVALLRRGQESRLVISSTSKFTRQPGRLLAEYKKRFAITTPETTNSDKPSLSNPPVPELTQQSLHELFLELPATGKRGTQWISIFDEASARKKLSFDRDGKTGILLTGVKGKTRAYRMLIAGTVPKARVALAPAPKMQWRLINSQRPLGFSETEITSAAISPDGTRIAWTNGAQIWTTNIDGGDPKRIGDETIVADGDLLFDPTGNWLIFSTPSATRGLNLMTLNRSGRCPKLLTEVPGDETDPSLSPDGKSLFFTQIQGGVARVARTQFALSDEELAQAESECGI
jgi:hypothetical protein